ncbi:MAG: indole-3-glycerol phosphate synthase TrpC [Planctomycetota bacterium]
MKDVLAEIVQHTRGVVEDARRRVSEDDIQRMAHDAEPPRNFFSALTRPAKTLRVIAEVKRASPSAGLIRPDFDPVDIARAYSENGAAAISCLTDEKYFGGDLAYLQQIKDAVRLPVLRKDFIVDPYQVYEARAAGADAILLIAECLGEPQMIDLMILATELRMTTLLEVHSLESLIQVKPHLGFPHPAYQLLGINNRNLKTMHTDVQHTLNLLGEVPNREVLVSESGITTHDDTQTLQRHSVHRVLVGEHLMRQPNVGLALRELIHGHTSTP